MILKGKRALVTGGASGIGRAIIERFVAEGAAVAVCDIDKEACCNFVEQLKASGHRAVGAIGDVSKTDSARRIVEEAVAALGGLEILVNNAGIETTGSVTTATDEDWERQIAVNLHGIYRVSRCAVPEIIRAGGGTVINMSSVGGLVAVKGFSAYGASKAAVIQLTRSMAADYAQDNIRVNCICPGPVETPLLQRACDRLKGSGDADRIRQAYANSTLLKRVARPEEIASCAAFLASNESSYVTGHALVADGGFSAQ